jgi:serine/threonine protein kinase
MALNYSLVMEYMGGGEVKWRDGRDKPILTVDQTRRIIRDVVLGLEYRKRIPIFTSRQLPDYRISSALQWHHSP